jgi:ubiquinone biosynthesis protein UbiJ
VLREFFAATLNRNIAGSSRARALCAKLEGRSLAVHVEAPLPLHLGVRVAQGVVHFDRAPPGESDATVTGTPLALLALVGRDSQARLRDGTVRLTGDGEIVQSFHELLQAARPDLEEEVSRLVGDVPAHQLGNLARSLSGWSRRSFATFTTNVAEYLQEESRDLVTRTEADEFNSAVDDLREAADRLEARIERLARGARR